MVRTESVEQVAERLGCSRRRVFQLLADGTLERAQRFGRAIRILSTSVDRALTQPLETKRRGRRRPDVAHVAPPLVDPSQLRAYGNPSGM